MKKITLFLSLLLISGIIFISCDSTATKNKSEKTTEETSNEILEESYPEDLTIIKRRFFNRTKDVYTSANASLYLKIKSEENKISYFAPTMHGTLFLIEEFVNINNDDFKYKYGLLDKNGRTLLKKEYENIGNPGFYGDELIEVKKDGKFGLYNYVSKKLTEIKYDYIIPSNVKEYVAFGYFEGKLRKITHSGEEREYRSSDKLIDFYALFKPNSLGNSSEIWCPWLEVSELEYPNEFETYNQMKMNISIPPSYIGNINLYFKNRNRSINEDEAKLTISTKKEGENFYTFITDLFVMTTESRGSTEYEATAYSVNKTTQTRKVVKLFTYTDYTFQHLESEFKPIWKWRNDSTLNVRDWKKYPENIGEQIAATRNRLFIVQKNGELVQLENGEFPQASTFLLKADDFKGCFIRKATFEEFQLSDDFDPEMIDAPVAMYTNHLSIADLELMKNEIYARHGKEFTGKTQSYFKGQKWYAVHSDYSEKELTEIEKKNIVFINQTISKLKKQGDKLLTPHVRIIYEAG